MPDVSLIQNGWPAALTLNVYSTFLTKVKFGFEPLTNLLLILYRPLPSFVTINTVSIS